MLIEVHQEGEGRQFLLSIKPASLTVAYDQTVVTSFDLEGRLLTAWVDGRTYVRTLDNRVIKKWRPPGRRDPWKRIEELGPEEKRRLLGQTRARVQQLLQLIQRGRATLRCRGRTDAPSQDLVTARLEPILAWDDDRLEGERSRFSSIYSPVGILPPDQYFALVLQATEGCHWNQCTFCHFYRDARFHIKSEEAFSEHISAVTAFFGEAIRLRRSIFLGDANALVIPQDRLLGMVDRINRAFPIFPTTVAAGPTPTHAFRGIYSFIDAFTGVKKSEADFRELKARNLRRVYLGVESGCDQLLCFMNKPATAEAILELTATMKRAGLQVGVIILIGAGGRRYAEAHIRETITLLNAMNLGMGDIIYFSPLVVSPTSDYARRAAEARICSLTAREQREQLEAIRSGLEFAQGRMPKISLYDIREFVY